MTLIQLLRGPGGDQESVIGLRVCSPAAWTLFTVLILLAILFTYVAMKIANKQYLEKKEVNYEFTRGDQ